ncbi:MAG: hypothetical protein ABI910_20330 [Gemmatimonadota bacterium]
MTELDPVRRVLTDRGCTEEIVKDGLKGLLDRWSAIVASLDAEYALGLDDFLNDMDVRDALAAVLPVAPPAERSEAQQRLDALDASLRAATVQTGCLWGEEVEEDDGLDPNREWWYYRRPTRLNEEFAGELEAWGLLHGDGDSA